MAKDTISTSGSLAEAVDIPCSQVATRENDDLVEGQKVMMRDCQAVMGLYTAASAQPVDLATGNNPVGNWAQLSTSLFASMMRNRGG